jgi:hypothetical protein
LPFGLAAAALEARIYLPLAVLVSGSLTSILGWGGLLDSGSLRVGRGFWSVDGSPPRPYRLALLLVLEALIYRLLFIDWT